MRPGGLRKAALALFALSLLFAVDAAIGSGIYAVHDLKHHHMPWRVWAASEWSAGRVPLWATGVASGFPMLAEGQTGVLYPPTMILFMTLPPGLALNWSLILHGWWAGVGAWVMLRACKRSAAGAMLGAVAFAFSGFMVSHGLYLGMQNAVSWLPWLLAAVLHRRWALASLAATLMLVAGHPQAAAIGILLAGALALRESWSIQGTLWRRVPWQLALAMILASGVASAQILASLELSELGMRGGGVESAFASIGSLPPQELVGAVLPEFFGIDRPGEIAETYYHRGDGYWGAGVNHWEMCFYLGIPVVILALMGARRERFWAGMAGLSLLLMLGGLTPAWDLLRSLPGLGFFRFPVRFSIVLTIAIAVMASRGLDELSQASADQRRRIARWVLGLGGLAVLGLMLLGLMVKLGEAPLRDKLEAHFMAQVEPPPVPEDLSPLQQAALPDPEPEDPAQVPAKIDRIIDSLTQSTSLGSSRVFIPIVLVLLTALVIRRQDWLGHRRSMLALVGLVYLDLWLFGSDYIERVPPEEAGLQTSTLAYFEGEPGAWRSTVVDRRQDPSLDGVLMSASLGLVHGTRDVIVTSPLMILRNEALLAKVGLDVGDKGEVKLERLAEYPELVDLLGLRWLLSVHDLEPLGYARLNPSGEAVGVFENPDPLPTGFLVSCAREVEEPFSAVLDMDPRQAAVVESATQLPDCESGGRAGRVTTQEISPTEIRFQAQADQPTLLVDNETWYPGWEAELNGAPAEVLRTDLLFRGVELPAGSNEVILRYRPTWAGRAQVLTSLGFLGIVGWGLWGWRQRRGI